MDGQEQGVGGGRGKKGLGQLCQRDGHLLGFPETERKLLQRGLFLALSGTAWDPLGVVLLVVIGEKFVSKSLPRTPKWKQAEGQGEWRMFFSNTFLKECVQVCSLDFVSLEFGVNLNRAGVGAHLCP